MHRPLRTLFTLLFALAVLGAPLSAPPAHADDTEKPWKITRYAVDVRTDARGTSTVKLDLDFDFGHEPGHGPFVTLVTQHEVADNPDVWRMVDITVGQVTSSTGAPVDVDKSFTDGHLALRIGNANKTVSGVQKYTINYTARGLLNPKQAKSGLDEFNWNAVGTGWQVPISNVSVKTTGPVPITRVACFSGRDYNRPCTAKANGKTATYSVASLDKGQGLQVVAGYPAGTFTDAEPRYEERLTARTLLRHAREAVVAFVTKGFAPTPVSIALSGATAVALIGAAVAALRRFLRDDAYAGVTPGLRPTWADSHPDAPGAGPAVVASGVPAASGLGDGTPAGRLRATAAASGVGATLERVDARRLTVAVHYRPPEGVRPGEAGVLLRGDDDVVDVTATILDLAVRGHLTITPLPKRWVFGRKRWEFTRLPCDEPVSEPERHVLATLFDFGSPVTTRDLRDQRYSQLLRGTRHKLFGRVFNDLGWFKRNAYRTRARFRRAGRWLFTLGLLATVYLAATQQLGWVGLALFPASLILYYTPDHLHARSAEGTAMLAQVRGFEQYLKTAEAHQLRFEEGVDIYSRYLPWAIVFGVAKRWTRLFAQLEATGAYQPQTATWYVGDGTFDDRSVRDFSRDVESSASRAQAAYDRAVAAATSSSRDSSTSGSSGGSGFDGGGGSGGGGGGGW